MISYSTLWGDHEQTGYLPYTLIHKYGINPRTLNNLKHNKSIDSVNSFSQNLDFAKKLDTILIGFHNLLKKKTSQIKHHRWRNASSAIVVDKNGKDEYSGAFSITSPAIGNLYSG